MLCPNGFCRVQKLGCEKFMRSTYQIWVVIFTRYSPQLLVFPRPWSAFALKFTYVHLALQLGSIEAVNHFRTGSGVSRQCQSVYTSTKHQAEHDTAVPQAVKGSCFTGSAQQKKGLNLLSTKIIDFDKPLFQIRKTRATI